MERPVGQHLLLRTFMRYKSAAKLREDAEERAFAARNPRRTASSLLRAIPRGIEASTLRGSEFIRDAEKL